MGLKINGSTSGSIEIDVPAVAGTDTSITIPAKNGGTFIVEESTGNIDLGPLDINGSASDDSVVIDGSGRLLVGTTSSYANFGGNGVQIQGSGGPELSLKRDVATDGSSLGFLTFYSTHGLAGAISCVTDGAQTASSTPGYLRFNTTPSGSASTPAERMKINNEGRLYVPGVYNFGSGTSANVVVDTDGQIRRATSSQKYKTDIETLQDSYADALLECRPVWYRSLIADDNPNHSFYGFIAEEVAEIDPRLVEWKTVEISYDEKGSVVTTPCDPEPEGVQYDRFVPHLLNLIKRQKEQLESQAASIASLEARLTALEGGAS